MKWIGQNIYDQIARFRNDVYLEDLSTTTETTALVVDSDGKISKNVTSGVNLANGEDNRVVTAVGANGLNAEASLIFDGSVLVTPGLDVKTSAADGNPLIRFFQSTTRRAFIQLNDTDNNLRIASEYGKLEFYAAGTDGSDSDIAYLQVAPTGIFRFGAADNDATLTSDGNMIFKIDADNDETGQSFAFQNNASTEVANLNESGDLQIDGAFTPGTVIASSYLDTDTAHLTTDQTFTGLKTFSAPIISDGNRTITTGDGAAIHVDSFNVTDGATSGSGTAAAFRHVSIEAPRLFATNIGVTTTDAATLYIDTPPVAGTNQTITNAYALWVDAGNARFDGDLIVGGDIDLEGDIDVNGTLETDALTVGGTNVLTGSLITTLGTISAGVWNGDVIASAYLDADTAHLSGTQSFTGTKTFDETISGAIDGNAATATTLATTRAIGGVNFNGSAAIDLPGVNAAGNQSTSGLAATATLAADATTLATPRAINGVDFDGSAAITIPTNRVYGTYIKLLPNDFLPNEDGGTSKGVHLDDTAPTGLKPGIAAMELVAIQDIPEGFKATHVDIYASTNLVIQAYEMDIDASGITSRSSAGNANTTLDITDVAATDSNFLAIIVTTTGTGNRVWGGRITIAPQ